MKLLPLIFALLLPLMVRGEVKVAFIEMTDAHGRRIELEPGGRFAHIAISFGDLWLHALAPGPVELASFARLKQIGTVAVILTLADRPEITRDEANRFLGKPYDFAYSWSDDAIYSSELAGKLLKLEPKPMDFEAPIWRGRNVPRHEPGLSPDDIYRLLGREPASLPGFTQLCGKPLSRGR